MYSKAIRVFREEGPISLVRKGFPFVWNRYIASVLPKMSVNYNGIEIKQKRNFDTVIPWSQSEQHRPNYESGTIAAIDQWVKQGDEVIIIGGGWGVTATKAAKKVGQDGNVSVFEGAKSEISKVEQTAKINGVGQTISINHAIVGPEIDLRGEAGEANYLSPDQLPKCDVLELDCEGSEIGILENIEINPRLIIVESHGFNGAPSSEVAEILKEQGYRIQSKEVADKGVEEFCEIKDIYVLTAVNHR